jgi:hypothetical protein
MGIKAEGKPAEKFIITLKELAKAFTDFEIDSIELSLEGGVETGKVLNLFVKATGNAGCTVKLKPKK